MENLKEIIEKLESVRKEQNLSYEQVAKMINTSRQTIWKILTGLNEPSAVTLLKLIDSLGFDFVIGKKDIYQIDIVEKSTSNKIPEAITQIKSMSKKIDSLPKEKPKKVKKVEVSKECPNCKYAQTQSGLTIKTLKCADCKKKK